MFFRIRIFALLALAFMVFSVFGQTPAPPEVPPMDFLAQVLEYVKQFGGLPWVLKIAGIITILLASMKVTFLNNLIWAKLGKAKAWAAPVLGLILGVLSLTSSGQLSLAGILAYISAGAGAVILHELLDTIKGIPGLGPVWVEVINVISSFLGGPKPKPEPLKPA